MTRFLFAVKITCSRLVPQNSRVRRRIPHRCSLARYAAGVALYARLVTPGALAKNPATQKLTRLEFLVPTEMLKRGENQIAIAVNRKGPFPPSTYVKVEKVEMHIK